MNIKKILIASVVFVVLSPFLLLFVLYLYVKADDFYFDHFHVVEPTRVPPTPLPMKEGEVFELVNEYRAENGVAPLILDENLCRFARERLEEVKTDFNHDRVKDWVNKEYLNKFVTLSENLSGGSYSARGAVNSWSWSEDGHNEAMLNPEYTHTCAVFSQEGGYQVQLFAIEYGY